MERYEMLLKEVKGLVEADERKRNAEASDFNIFSITGILDKEVPICAFLGELLRPDGSHMQGGMLLKSFLENVLEFTGLSERDCDRALVTAEKKIADDRRIDLYIEIAGRCIPIEAKIYAKDQDVQLSDYLNYARRYDPNAIIYYLTLDNHEPSQKSKGYLVDNDYKCISFAKDIYDWLQILMDMDAISGVVRLREGISQFMQVIRRLTGRGENIMSEAIGKMLVSSLDFVAANEIGKALMDREVSLMKEIFSGIEKGVGNRLGEKKKLFPVVHRDYDERAYKYYHNRVNTWPNLNYLLPRNEGAPDNDFVLRIEIEERLYFGVSNWDDNTKTNPHTVKNHPDKKLNRYYVMSSSDMEGSDTMTDVFYWWRYLPENGRINFKNLNEGYEKLFDGDYFKEYIENVCDQIFSFMKTWESMDGSETYRLLRDATE